MASNLKVSTTAAAAQAAALAALANGGYLDIYATTQPTTPETAAGGSALVTFALPATFAASTTAGLVTANAITAVNATNTGTALWFRVTKADHTTPVFDGSVGTTGCDLNLVGTAVITAGLSTSISSLTYSAVVGV